MKIAVPDLISPSYLPAEAIVTMGYLAAEGVKAELELIAPVEAAYAAMRDGHVDIVAGSAHSTLSAFPRWEGAKLLCAQSQGLYWFLVMRSDIGAKRGDLSCVKGRRIGAAPWVGMAFRQMLADSGIDMKRDGVEIVTVPGSIGKKINIGVVAARALGERLIDGFWANGMGAEIAVLSGAGTLVIDARRGDGPKNAQRYTFSALVTTQKTIDERPGAVATAIRAVVRAQRALKNDPSLAAAAAKKHFPAAELALIPELVRRDAPYYDPTISREAVDSLNAFARATGLLSGAADYERAVATQYQSLWIGPP